MKILFIKFKFLLFPVFSTILFSRLPPPPLVQRRGGGGGGGEGGEGGGGGAREVCGGRGGVGWGVRGGGEGGEGGREGGRKVTLHTSTVFMALTFYQMESYFVHAWYMVQPS